MHRWTSDRLAGNSAWLSPGTIKDEEDLDEG